jgi:hypothetical protein
MKLTIERATVNDWFCRIGHGKPSGHWHAPPPSSAFSMAFKSAFLRLLTAHHPLAPFQND